MTWPSKSMKKITAPEKKITVEFGVHVMDNSCSLKETIEPTNFLSIIFSIH